MEFFAANSADLPETYRTILIYSNQVEVGWRITFRLFFRRFDGIKGTAEGKTDEAGKPRLKAAVFGRIPQEARGRLPKTWAGRSAERTRTK
jgi:hypothetical protein